MSLVSGTSSSLKYNSGTTLQGVDFDSSWVTNAWLTNDGSTNLVTGTTTSYMANSITLN